jgi:hypothetical protein
MQAQDVGTLRVVPQSGTLGPGGKALCKVILTPKEQARYVFTHIACLITNETAEKKAKRAQQKEDIKKAEDDMEMELDLISLSVRKRQLCYN